MVVFAAGLYRRLRAALPGDSIAPTVAFAGLLGTAFVLVMGSGLDTEFMLCTDEDARPLAANAAIYNHWIGTIPWCWGLAGLSGIALFATARAGGVPRWLGRSAWSSAA